jgi:RimJ/RimL family protein N-acetyltransferase
MLPLIDNYEDLRSSVQLTLAARVGLRLVNTEDAELLQQWFELADVQLSWGPIGKNIEFFTNPPALAEQRIIFVEGADVGYIRWQLVHSLPGCHALTELLEKGAYRIDVLIGPRDRRFVGLGSVALRRVREEIAVHFDSLACFGYASVHHLAARRAYEKAGFRNHYFYDDEQGGPSVAMVRKAP